ncbi:MAG: glycosyltransferase family 2 protein [Thermoanaerobaculia bacterium]
MSSRPLVSVIVPTRNRANILRRCIDALAGQTYDNFEVIVIDDASTDDTPATLAALAAENPRLGMKVLTNSPQLGANPSRNRGIAASHGDLLAFEDDDCIADPRWIEGLVAAFVSDRVGAVTGIVEDMPPKNIYDLAMRGTHRAHGKVHASRIIAGNMCVRRVLIAGKLDEDRARPASDISVSGRGDEEGLFLRLKAEGYEVRVAHDARVEHVHHYTRRSLYRQAYRSGKSTAKVGYKYRLPPRIELVCLAGGYAFALGALFTKWSLLLSGACFAAFAGGALVYNEIWRKKKTILEAIQVAGVMTLYYHLRAGGYFLQHARLLAGAERIERVKLATRA